MFLCTWVSWQWPCRSLWYRAKPKTKTKIKTLPTALPIWAVWEQDRVTREVRHELVMRPYYGVFDNLAYRVDGGTVRLYGQVTRPTLKSDAENVVKGIDGVTRVDNQIEVLPLSSMDDGIRIAAYRTIFGKPGLDLYAMQAVPPIHIIVNNGKVTLEGVVATEGDKNQAGIYVNTVSSVFSVTNNLRVEGERK